MERLVSCVGLIVLMGLAWLMSSNRRRFPWRVAVLGLVLQITFAVLVLRTGPGRAVFEFAREAFVALTGCAQAGTRFLLGPAMMEQEYITQSFAVQVLPVIIFFSTLMSVLYYLGIMQRVIGAVALAMRWTLGTSGTETLAAAANIFVGQSEAPLVVRPYLQQMTQSELMSLMVVGFATVSGSVLAAYTAMGIDPGHLLTASVISAPAALAIAKIMQPEVEQPIAGTVQAQADTERVNIIHAAAIGASDGFKLAVNVAALLLAFLGLVALLNLLLGWMGGWFGYVDEAGNPLWTLEAALGSVFAPLAWLIGVEASESRQVGYLLGIKMVANEFVAYDQLGEWMAGGDGSRISERSRVLATYALCGFSNFGSIAVQLGGIGALVPNRRADLARLGFRAMLGGSLATLMTACVAGMLI